jgi:hypothetical protein
VLTRPGLFGGALSLRGLAIGARGLRLVGSLGFSQHRGATPGPEAAGARDALEICRRKLPPSARPLAFLDYLAAERLSPVSAEALVRGFAEQLARRRRGGRVPLIGGETAEMPSTFRPDGWEVVGALFGLAADPGGNPAAGLGRLEGCAHPALVFTMDGVGT